MKIKRKIECYLPNQDELSVLEAVQNYLHLDVWDSFSKVNIRIKEEIDAAIKDGHITKVQELQRLKKRIVFARISEMKKNIYDHYAKLTRDRDLRVYCFYCENDLVDRSRPLYHLDHIAPKSLHYEFSLDPFNLVPSCVMCNTVYKRSKETIIEKGRVSSDCKYSILHPYIDNKEDYFEFCTRDNAKITCIMKKLDGDNYNRAKETIKMFDLNHSSAIEENIKKGIYNESSKMTEEFLAHIWDK